MSQPSLNPGWRVESEVTVFPVGLEDSSVSHLEDGQSELDEDAVVVGSCDEGGHLTHLSRVVDAVGLVVRIEIHCVVAQFYLHSFIRSRIHINKGAEYNLCSDWVDKNTKYNKNILKALLPKNTIA